MNYCTNCGNKLDSNANYCNHCGLKIGNNIPEQMENNVSYQPVNNDDDDGGIGWGLLGFFVPLVGLVLYIAWKNDKPKNAKSAGKGALISVILNIVLVIVCIIFYIMMAVNHTSTIDNDYDDFYYNDQFYDFY